ncbi:glycosyl hydrolase family 62 protein [Crepidotus variabilis]|uniref:Alpha-L-arabinofuranosidase n=1 Tax=Crepidotus variabilis TaxID=179855 RepID=A0A9P6EFT7_9AGAR|nr:glycosyl hydrolase family 62 protein [Crepidotus variabilis]
MVKLSITYFIWATALATLTAAASLYNLPASLPTSFNWTSSGILISPKSDSYEIAGVKDPSVIYHEGRYHVFASTAKLAGYSLVYLNFTDFAHASSTNFTYLDTTSIGTGYRAAPQVFYFTPTKTWYLVYQNGNAAYSTNSDINNPNGWSSPKTFYPDMPTIIADNIADGYWVDMWVICDSRNCHLFSSDDNGHLYRSDTTLSNFPSGFSEPVIAMQDPDKYRVYEASNVYKVNNIYLLIVEAIGTDGRRYFRSWTSSTITGTWHPLADSESHPFARANNVDFNDTTWTQDISHGEMVRTIVDQTMTIHPCNMHYLYQGMDPSAGGEYNGLPWRIGLLKQTNSSC